MGGAWGERGGSVGGEWSHPSQELRSHRPRRRPHTTLTAAALRGRPAGAAVPRSMQAGSLGPTFPRAQAS